MGRKKSERGEDEGFHNAAFSTEPREMHKFYILTWLFTLF